MTGSYARGDFNLWSDVDIVLIADFSGNPIERLKLVDEPSGFQVITLREEEFLRLLQRRNPIAVEAAQSGVMLRDDYGISRATCELAGIREVLMRKPTCAVDNMSRLVDEFIRHLRG